MALAQIGPLTSAIEAAAAVIGAAMLLGGFATGLEGLVTRRPRYALEQRALGGAYIGGSVGCLTVLADIIFRYIL
jgi:hypothetical protein